MIDIRQYKCPCCGGAIEFDTGAQKMKCQYCDTEFEVEAVEQYDEDVKEDANSDMKWDTSDMQDWDMDSEGVKVYVCESCGGEIVADENTAAAFCPFCDNPIVVKKSVSGTIKPEVVIPFKLDKKAAKAAFADHLKGKKLLPKVFKDENHIEEIKGIYVPYWLFDTKAEAHMRYRATRDRYWSDSRYNYHETQYYAVLRDGDIAFAHVPVDGSSKMADDLMESIEPFDYSTAVKFTPDYFAGYYADKYDVEEKTCETRANERMRNSTEQSFMNTVHGFSSVRPDGGRITLRGGKARYAMYPVWILNTKWNGETYMFAMNGQTGKFVGNLPMDKGLFRQYFAKSFVIVAAIAAAIQTLIWFI